LGRLLRKFWMDFLENVRNLRLDFIATVTTSELESLGDKSTNYENLIEIIIIII